MASTHLLPRSTESSPLERPLIPGQNYGHWPHAQAEPFTPNRAMNVPLIHYEVRSRHSPYFIYLCSECPTSPLQGGTKTFTNTFIKLYSFMHDSRIQHAMP